MMLNCVICHHCFVGKYLNQKTKLALQQYGSCWLWWNTAKNGKFRKMAEALCCPSLVSSTFCRSAQSLICIHRFACPRHLRPDTQFSVLCCQDWSPVTATGAGSPSVTETSSGKSCKPSIGNYYKERATIWHYANQPICPLWPLCWRPNFMST